MYRKIQDLMNYRTKIKLANWIPFLIKTKKNSLQLESDKSYLLLYHSFTEYERPYYFNITGYEKFYGDILLLKKYFSFSNTLENISPKNIYLTFDDGYKSILPVLQFCESNKIPTTIFVNTILFENTPLLPKDAIWQACRNAPKGTTLTFLGESVTLQSTSPVFRDYLAMYWNTKALRTLSYSEYKEQSYTFFSPWQKQIDEDLAMLTKEDLNSIKELQFCRVESHGYLHHDLTRATDTELKKELVQSKVLLEKHNASVVKYISTPYGLSNDYVEKNIQKSGYTASVSIDESPVTPGISYSRLPRYSVDNRPIIIV